MRSRGSVRNLETSETPRHRRVVHVAGPPTERGRQYGAQTRDLIHASIAGYEHVFHRYAEWEWGTVRTHALAFRDVVGDFSAATLTEMVGIADGAGVELADVLALNTRSEIMFAARNNARRTAIVADGECTSFAVVPAPAAASPRDVVIGQNWDWLVQSYETAVVLHVERDDAPSFVTLVEAGLVAKVGLNAAGVGLCTNTLISDGAEGRVGVPYHVLLRAVLDSTTGAAAAARITDADRATSANYLIADTTGFVTDLETAPYAGGVRAIQPVDGVLTHANHFLNADLTSRDMYLATKPHSTVRQRNLARRLDDPARGSSIGALQAVLADHTDAPDSVCQHPRESVHPFERTATIGAALLDMRALTMHYTPGNPCEGGWRRIGLRRPHVSAN